MRTLKPGFYEGFMMFSFGLRMNVTIAHEIVGAPYAEPDGYVHVESLRSSRCIKFLTAYDKADLSEPVMIATIGGIQLLVDGRHRAKRALVQRKSTLPCYILTEKETEKCFEGKQQQQKYRKLRDFLRKVEIQVIAVPGNTTRREDVAKSDIHPPTVRRPR